MGSSAPNLPYTSRLQAMMGSSGSAIAMNCLAQGNPVPNSRWICLSHIFIISRLFASCFHTRVLYRRIIAQCFLCESVQTFFSPFITFVKKKVCAVIYKLSEPLVGVNPKVQYHPPVFSRRGEPAVITCEAQGNPTPAFKYVVLTCLRCTI